MIKKLSIILAMIMSVWMLLGADVQTDKQEECPHGSWKNGVCAVCGAEPPFFEEPEEKYFEHCVHSGEVLDLTYDTPVYYQEIRKPVYHRAVQVYLPYGYNPEIQYDVVVLIAPTDLETTFFLSYANDPDHPEINGKDLIDNLHYYGDIKPMIVVSMGSWKGGYVDRWEFQLASEIKYNLLPMICSEYSTYAEEPTPEGIEKARDHFAVGGWSNGGMHAYAVGLKYDKDIFGSVLALSPKLLPKDIIDEVAKTDEKYAVNMLYVGAGNREGNTKKSLEQYEQLLEACPWLEDGRNAFYSRVVGVHNWAAGRKLMLNGLMIAF